MVTAGASLSSCCKQCAPCANCYDHSISKIQDVLYAVNYKLSDNLEQLVCEMRWGYSQRRPIAKEKLHVYRRAILNHLKALRNDYPTCLCPSEFQIILEDTLNIVGLSCCKDTQRRDLIIDKTGLEQWALMNTGCVVYEEWEKAFRKACPTLGIVVKSATTLEEITKLFYTLSVSTYDSCAVLYNVRVATIAMQQQCYDVSWNVQPIECNTTALATVIPIDLERCLSYGLTIEQAAQCKVDYDILISNTQCDLTFSTYIDLLSCSLTSTVISNLINCGVNVSYSAELLCPVLEIGKTIVHLYDDLDLTNLTEDIFSCDFQLLDLDGDE